MQRGLVERQYSMAVLMARPCWAWERKTICSKPEGKRKYRAMVSRMRALPPSLRWWLSITGEEGLRSSGCVKLSTTFIEVKLWKPNSEAKRGLTVREEIGRASCREGVEI